MAEEKKRSIHEGHRERLRERWRETGSDHFNDHEVLEMLLGYTILQKDTNPIAHRLIDHFGNLRGVFEAGEEELLQIAQVGPGTAFFLSMLPDITRRYYQQTADKKVRLLEPEQAKEFFLPHFIGRKNECVYAAFLSETRLLLDYSLVSEGALNAVSVHMPKIVKEARRTGCRFVIIAHNHFTDAIPSFEDLAVTRHAAERLRDIGVKLMDHVIVCGAQATSMAESGHLRKLLPVDK